MEEWGEGQLDLWLTRWLIRLHWAEGSKSVKRKETQEGASEQEQTMPSDERRPKSNLHIAQFGHFQVRQIRAYNTRTT